MLSQIPVNKEDALIRAALKLFRRKGYHGATIAEIAAEAGIQKGSVYYYISSKEDLLKHAIVREMDVLIAAVEGIVHDDLTPEEKLRKAIGAHVCFLAEHPDSITVAVPVVILTIGAADTTEIIARRDRYERLFRSIIAEGVACGDFADVDPPVATMAILGMCNYLYIWYRASGRLTVDEIADAFGDILLKGMLSKGSEESLRRVRQVERKLALQVSRLGDSLEKFRDAQLDLLSDMKNVLADEYGDLAGDRGAIVPGATADSK